MLNQFSRTQLLFGKEGMEKLYQARVAVFGIGGVGGYTVEALYAFGPEEGREAVLLFNENTKLTEESTVEYII